MRTILDIVIEKGYKPYATEQFTYKGITHIYDIDTLKDIVAFKYVKNTLIINDKWLNDELVEQRFFIEMVMAEEKWEND